MTLSNSPLVTPLPRRDNGSDAGSGDQDRLAELRSELATLQQTIAGMTGNAAAEVERLGTQSAQLLRSNIEAQPWMSIGAAAAAGALLAVAIIPKKSRGFRYNDAATYTAHDMADAVRRVAARGIDTQPITSRFERLVDSISSIDTTALTSSPAYDTAKTWLQSLVSGVRKE
jgi:ElaB/YqjD/DUF883 family membrane-anchored ribosome-binding protein